MCDAMGSYQAIFTHLFRGTPARHTRMPFHTCHNASQNLCLMYHLFIEGCKGLLPTWP